MKEGSRSSQKHSATRARENRESPPKKKNNVSINIARGCVGNLAGDDVG